MIFNLVTTVLIFSRLIVLNALPQTTVDIVHENYQSIPKPVQTLNLEGLDYLLRYASTMFDKHLKSQSETSNTQIEAVNINEKYLPPVDNDRGYYMPFYMTYHDDKIDNKNKHLLKITPPEKSNEPNYYSAKPKKIPKKFSSTVKHVNIKREAVLDRKIKEESSSTTEFAPKLSYNGWIPIIGHTHKNARGNYDVVYGTLDNDDSGPLAPEQMNEQQNVKSKVKKIKSRSKRGTYDILSKNERLQYQMHGFGGPKTYKFGYDTGKGKDRHFRFEERRNDGSVKGEYGFVDDQGKMSVVRYSSNAETGFQVQH